MAPRGREEEGRDDSREKGNEGGRGGERKRARGDNPILLPSERLLLLSLHALGEKEGCGFACCLVILPILPLVVL